MLYANCTDRGFEVAVGTSVSRSLPTDVSEYANNTFVYTSLTLSCPNSLLRTIWALRVFLKRANGRPGHLVQKNDLEKGIDGSDEKPGCTCN